MQEKVTFGAQLRTILGKKVKTIRRDAEVPANIIGHLDKPVAIRMSRLGFTKLYDKVGDTGLVYLKLDTESQERPVLVDDVQLDPVSGQILHVVFRQVDLTEKITAEVPVELVGILNVREAVVVTVHDEVSVSALPQDLPEKFVVDIGKFTEIGQTVTFEQLDYNHAKVTLDVPVEQLSTPIVMVQEVKEEVVEEPVVAAVPAEGEAPATEGVATTETPVEAKPAASEKKEEKK